MKESSHIPGKRYKIDVIGTTGEYVKKHNNAFYFDNIKPKNHAYILAMPEEEHPEIGGLLGLWDRGQQYELA